MTLRACKAIAVAAIVEVAACGCPDDGAIVTYTGTDALARTAGIYAMEYLIVASPAPDCATAIAALRAGGSPPGTVYDSSQQLAPVYVRNDFRLVPPPSRRAGCRAGSATGTFVALHYDSVEPVCFEAGCPPAPPLLATACAEGVTIYADRTTRLELPVQPVP